MREILLNIYLYFEDSDLVELCILHNIIKNTVTLFKPINKI